MTQQLRDACAHHSSQAHPNYVMPVGRRINMIYFDPSSLTAFVACRLIALDKCPGVRPIGMDEVARHNIGKVVVRTISNEVQEANGPLQTRARHILGCQAAVPAMHQVFGDTETDGVKLVDASNALNCLNHQTALLSIKHLYAALSGF